MRTVADAGELRLFAQTVDRLSARTSELAGGLRSGLSRLGEHWREERAETFAAELDGLTHRLDRFCEVAEEFARCLKQMSEELEAYQRLRPGSGANVGRFVERGTVPLRVGTVPTQAIAISASDFVKCPLETMLAGVVRYDREVRPAILLGHSRDYFRALDRATGVAYADGLEKLFDVFHGSDPIRVVKMRDGSIDVLSGRHRLYAARTAGIDRIPVSLSEELSGDHPG